MKDIQGRSQTTEAGPDAGQAVSLSRRRVLRAGATAMPVVLTLQSGEALARTSNLIGAAPGARDDGGNVLCLDTTYEDVLPSGKIDIGLDGATVNVIPDTDFYLSSAGGTSGGSVSAEVYCQEGLYRKFQDSGWNYVELPTNGVVVSSIALNSVGARAPIFMRNWTDIS